MLDLVRKIVNSAKKYNLPYKIVLAQAILETGYFKKYKYNNVFGIKATKKDIDAGKYYEVQTTEYTNGQKKVINAKFAKFSSIDEAVKRYNEIIKRNFPYADKNRHNDMLFLQGLFKGKYKYATDPKYIDKIKKIIKQLDKAIKTNKKPLSIGAIGIGAVFLYFLTKKYLQK
jgi:flagellum-specific peptidoglycan hydrolase FlgJ